MFLYYGYLFQKKSPAELTLVDERTFASNNSDHILALHFHFYLIVSHVSTVVVAPPESTPACVLYTTLPSIKVTSVVPMNFLSFTSNESAAESESDFGIKIHRFVSS